MDTKLSNIELTQKQLDNLGDLKVDGIKGVTYWPERKELVVVSEYALTEETLAKVKKCAKELSTVAKDKPATIEERVTELELSIKALQSVK